MKRLAVAVLLAFFAHGLLLLTGDFQVQQKSGRDADEPKRISVSLEHYTPHEEDGKAEEVLEHEFELPEEPEQEKLEDDPDQEAEQEKQPEQPKPEKKQTEKVAQVEKAPVLQEAAEAAQEAEFRLEQEEKAREQEAQKPEKKASSLDASPAPEEPAGASRQTSRAALEAQEALEEYISDAGKEDEEEVQKSSPLYRDNPPPEYPRRAMQRNQQGTVVLEVLVNSRGRVEEIEVAESSGYSVLDRAALEAVQGWVFQPGRKGDSKIDTRVRVPVRFELQ